MNMVTRLSSLNPFLIFAALLKHRYLIGQLTRRDVLLKYRGSYLGIGWSFLYPLLLLLAFTLVFGGVFGGRWGRTEGGAQGIEMALFIYCALIIFSPFAEVINVAPKLLSSNQNFVKKIIFPTEILPLVSILTASVHGVINLLLLILAAILAGYANPSLIFAPVVLLPVWLFTVGIIWFLSAAGAYVRDLVHGMPVITQLLMFMLPVFYPVDAAPSFLRNLHAYNPLAIAMEDMRRIVLAGQGPDWRSWSIVFVSGIFCAVLGYQFFMRCKEEFVDVL